MVEPMKYLTLCAAILAVSLGCFESDQETEPRKLATVGRIIDGDTVELEDGETQLQIYGIDCPQRKERGFQSAKHFAETCLLDHEIEYRSLGPDKYGRINAVVWCDSQEYGELVIDAGLARVREGTTRYETAQTMAKARELGIWKPETDTGL